MGNGGLKNRMQKLEPPLSMQSMLIPRERGASRENAKSYIPSTLGSSLMSIEIFIFSELKTVCKFWELRIELSYVSRRKNVG